MRLVFAGTPEFAALALRALIATGHDIPLVLTQPDRPAGRGMKLKASPVKEVALARGIPVHQPERLRTAESQAPIRAARADAMVVAAYGLILPQAVLDIPPRGCLNIHASLLPRWRGAAPVQRAILAGDAETGIGIMRMEAGLDTGPVLLEKRLAIGPRETAGTLTDRLAELGARAIVEALADLDRLSPRVQDEAAACYAPKIAKSEARIDWRRSPVEIDRQVRAFNPAPGAETMLAGASLKVWEAFPVEGSGSPGSVIGARDGCPVVACGEGALALAVVQRAGARRLPAAEFVRGWPLPEGATLGGGEPPPAA